MQEEIEKETVALAISGSKITGRTLEKAISVYLNHRKGKLPGLKQCRQTIKDLIKHNIELERNTVENAPKQKEKFLDNDDRDKEKIYAAVRDHFLPNA